MMSVPAEGAERLAEILREIFALSEPNGPNRSKSTAADEPIVIRVYDEAGNVIETHEQAGESKERTRFWASQERPPRTKWGFVLLLSFQFSPFASKCSRSMRRAS
jgi:hypothetical protein